MGASEIPSSGDFFFNTSSGAWLELEGSRHARVVPTAKSSPGFKPGFGAGPSACNPAATHLSAACRLSLVVRVNGELKRCR
jgi:hypothetical protein